MQDLPQRYQSTVLEHIQHSETTFSLIFNRCGMPVEAGKEIMLHGETAHMDRQYSIASGEQDETLRVLYKLIPTGQLTPRLRNLAPGDPIEFTGPFGSFILRDPTHPIVFVATGTGIAPAISFIRSYPSLALTLLHGVRLEEDLYDRELFTDCAYHPCISGDAVQGLFPGRVTDKLEAMTLNPDAHYYLCGANAMILDARRTLIGKGVPDQHIFSEAYYFW